MVQGAAGGSPATERYQLGRRRRLSRRKRTRAAGAADWRSTLTARVTAGHVLVLAMILLLPAKASADWPTDPSVNLPLCVAPNLQLARALVADGSGGAIVTWVD